MPLHLDSQYHLRQPNGQRRTEILLENKNGVIYGGGGFIGGAVARTIADVASYTIPASMTTRRHKERQRDD